MATVTSDVAVCNLALSHLNAGTVTDISTNPTTDEEKECNRWYDTTRRALLRKYVWNFARKRRTITRDTTAPVFGYEDAYSLPNDFIRLISFANDDELDQTSIWYQHRFNYEIEGQKILVNNDGEESLNIVYIYDVKNVSDFDALFVETLALKLAYNMAYKFTTKKSVVDRIADQLKEKELEAAAIDGQERPPKRIQRSYLNSARRRHGTSTVASKYTIFER